MNPLCDPELMSEELKKEFVKREKQNIKNSDVDFRQLREQDYVQKLLDLAETLEEKHKKHAKLNMAIAELKFSEEQLKTSYMYEAKTNGVKLITERKDYAKALIADSQINKDRRNLVRDAAKLESEIMGLEIKFKALRTVMEFQLNMRRKD